MRVSNAGGQIICGERTAQPGYVLVGPVERAAERRKRASDQFLCAGMMDIARLEFCQDLDGLFDWQRFMGALRIEWGKRSLDHAARVFDHSKHLGCGRQDDDLSPIDLRTPLFVASRRVHQYPNHRTLFVYFRCYN